MQHRAPGGSPIAPSAVNAYLARKQCLLPSAQGTDVVAVTTDIVALHATAPTSPFLSLWARMRPVAANGFSRDMLEHVLYETRGLARIPCMRNTVHVVPSDEVPRFLSAYGQRALPPEFRDWGSLFARAGLCQQEEAEELQRQLTCRVVDVVKKQGPLTVREITRQVPELAAKVQHSEGREYEGAFSLGSRFVPFLCAAGALIRARPRGSWRSNLYEYAAMADWLSGSRQAEFRPREAQAWLVKRYLRAYGPATRDDVQWWTGFSTSETDQALAALGSQVVPVAIEGLGEHCLMLAEDEPRLQACTPPRASYGFFLPGLDPYIMGYRDRRRFLAIEHQSKVFDRAGNALPSVWANGRVVGAWTQRPDASVAYDLFEVVDNAAKAVLEEQRKSLEEFFGGEYVPQRTHSPFTRRLEKWTGASSPSRQGS